jgi:hypothetical protein
MTIMLFGSLLQYLALKSLSLNTIDSKIEKTKISILSFRIILGFDFFNVFEYSLARISIVIKLLFIN